MEAIVGCARWPRDSRYDGDELQAHPSQEVGLRLEYQPPYDWNHVRGFLATRALSGVERVDDRGYTRTVALKGRAAFVRVEPMSDANALELRVRGAPPEAISQLASTARRVFDLAVDPARIAAALAADPLLAPLVRARPGLRIPGAWDAFECGVRAVLGQQVSVAAGRTLTSRVVARAGRVVADGKDGLTHLFPSADALAGADLSGLGITGARIQAVRAMAQAVLENRLNFAAPADEIASVLASLRGFGRWTAQYVALRALGEPDAFPSGDLVLRRALGVDGALVTQAFLERRAERWRPWRGYAVMHLWAR